MSFQLSCLFPAKAQLTTRLEKLKRTIRHVKNQSPNLPDQTSWHKVEVFFFSALMYQASLILICSCATKHLLLLFSFRLIFFTRILWFHPSLVALLETISHIFFTSEKWQHFWRSSNSVVTLTSFHHVNYCFLEIRNFFAHIFTHKKKTCSTLESKTLNCCLIN